LAGVGLDLPKVSVQTSALYLDPVGISMDDEGDEMPDFGGMLMEDSNVVIYGFD
jgi:hypothetical protein